MSVAKLIAIALALVAVIGLLPFAIVALCLSPVAVHELGHVVFGRLVGYRPWACGIGHGGRSVSVKLFGVVFFLSARQPFGGFTLCGEPCLAPNRWRRVVMLAGGMVANLFVAVVCGVVVYVWWDYVNVCRLVGGYAVLNLILLASALPVPSTIGRVPGQSDGLAILNAWRGAAYAAAGPLNFYHDFEPFLRKVGATTAVIDYGHAAANFWALLGRPGRAREILAELPAATGDEPPGQLAHWAFFRSAVEYAADEFDAAVRGVDEAEAGFAAAGDATGVAVTRLARVQILVTAGRPAQADALWATIPGAELGDGQTHYAALSAMRAGDAAAAELAIARYAAPVWAMTDPAQRVEQWHDVAKAAVAGRLWTQAAHAFQEAARATVEARKQLVFQEDADEVRAAADALLTRSRECEAMAGDGPGR